MLARRGFLGLLGPVLLGGCGFHPLYARNANGDVGPVQTELAAISVGIIPDRPGQLLRQALQERFQLGADGVARRYDLSVSYGIRGDALAIRPDNASTYTRLIANANWLLRAQDPQTTLLARGSASASDNYNIFDTQYFNADLNNEAAQARLAQAIADRMFLQISAYFDRIVNDKTAAG